MLSSLSSSVIKDRWVLKKKVGKGTFCEMFLGRAIIPFDVEDSQVAIKVQAEDIEKNVIRLECEVLKALSGLPTVPRFIKAGKHENRDFMVMELLSGEDMAHLRDRIRANTGMRLVPLPGCIYLTQQMLKCIKGIHDMGYIHRDIKPANFIRRTVNSTEFVMIDFGITKSYRDIHGNLRPKRENCEFRGTAQYASPFAHEGHDQCPRDDLLGLLLVFFDLICGKLPWLESARSRDKVTVTDMKKRFFSEPKLLVNYVHDMAESEMQNKASVDMERYDNFPQKAQHQSLIMIQYLMGLKYEDIPDYNMLDTWFSQMLSEEERAAGHKTRWEEISQENYSYRGFHWGGGASKRADEKDRLSSDPSVQQEVALSRMRYLTKLLAAYKSLETNADCSSSSSSSSSSSKKRRYSTTEEPIERGEVKPKIDANSESSTTTTDTRADASSSSSDLQTASIEKTEQMRLTEATELTEVVAGQTDETSSTEYPNLPPEQREEVKPVSQASLTAAAAVGTTPTTPRISSGTVAASSGSGTATKSSKSGMDLFPEMKTITCHEATATLWGLVVGELESIHRQHLKRDVLHDIFTMAEKHAFFQHLLQVRSEGSHSQHAHEQQLETFKMESNANSNHINGSAGANMNTAATAEASDIAWAQMNRIAYANKIFRYLDVSMQGSGPGSKRKSIG